jgi:sialic acid synthase SpsE
VRVAGGVNIGGVNYTNRAPLIIAELGTGFGTDLTKAKELICAAKESDASCIKIQIVKAAEILHPASGIVSLPGGDCLLYDVFKSLEVPPSRAVDFYFQIKEYAESRGCLFLASVFGKESAAILHELEPQCVKVASPELNHFPLLRELSTWNVPTFLSSGVSTLADIEKALAIFDNSGVCLFHCVTAYPAPVSEYNLRLLDSLAAMFGVPVAVSDHSSDPVLVPSLAVLCGAIAVEKHFCLSHDGGGLDDKIALVPDDFKKMTVALKKAVRGTAFAAEKKAQIDDLKKEYGEAKVEAVLGDGVKRLAASERKNYGRTNRSLHAAHAINAGVTFTKENVSLLRTEKVLRPGLPPEFEDIVLGRIAKKHIPDGEGISWDDI